MRKVVLNLAISLDGYICDNDGGFDWIGGHGDSNLDTIETDNFDTFLESVDTVVMGSIAYEDCVLTGLATFDDKQIIVATTRKLESRKNVRFINKDISSEILKLKNQEGKDLFIFGGAGLVENLMNADIIDKFIVGIIPTLLGKGRSLFKGTYNEIKLHLDRITVSDGITILTYSKRKQT
ncbi:MAG: dihydrofolate reductase family protein [Bacillota bacterium]|nr:dihydrofolate reductase family protein [Bacillota bacterium]MDW7676797.1 dihydrofolate reductase family protein [Bacillota bacterium]